jgi:ABC-type uncharacterized transport system permease subunit
LLNYYIKPPNACYSASDFFPKEGVLPSFVPQFLPGLYKLFSDQTSITIMLYILLVAIYIAYFIMFRTPFGYELRMVGLNIHFARYGGINTRRVITLVMAVSGIFAGLAGAHLAMGIHTKLILNLSFGLAFEGIVVALLARNNPLLVPLTGLAYGYLRAGADIMERSSDVSREVVLIIQAIIILLVTAEQLIPWVRQRVTSRRQPAETPAPGGAHES